MQQIKTIVDELALLGTILSQEDITEYIIEGLDPTQYQSIIDAVQARDTPITFEELHEKFINNSQNS